MAPEIVSKVPYIGEAADMWACGVVMHLLVTGNLPFKSSEEKSLFRKIQKGFYPVPSRPDGETVSNDCRDLLKSLLDVDQTSRIRADTAVLHPWITRNL